MFVERCSEECRYDFVAITKSCFNGASFKERFRFVRKYNFQQSFI